MLRALLLAIAAAACVAGCSAAYKTDLLRKDVLSDAQQAIADTKLDQGTLTITVSADRADTTYDPGQPITLSVSASKDAFIAILRVLPSGETTIVFPNRAERDVTLPAGKTLTAPHPGDPVKIVADKPGIVLFEVIGSTNGQAWPFTRAPDNGSDFANLGVTTRDIAKNLTAALRGGGFHDVAATQLTVRITGRSLL